MASRPIVLWNKYSNNVVDDGGVNIKKTILPPTLPPAPYIDATRESKEKKYHFMPSLVYFCIQSLYQFPDQIHAIGNISLRYQPPPSPFAYDILRVLIPSYDPNDPNDKTFELYESPPPLDLTEMDPRLWATLIQIYENLPYSFNTYPIPLSDPHLPLLQKIPSTPQFTMITVLELPGCTELTDETIVELKALHSLCALDASWTKLTTYGIKVLAGTLLWDDETDDKAGRRSRRGPWGLRILRLRHCWKIENSVFPHLAKFVLLSVLDLRGTRCTRTPNLHSFRHSNETQAELYYPYSISYSINKLASFYDSSASPKNTLFSSPCTHPYTLHVSTLHHPTPSHPPTQERHVPMEDTYVTFPSSEGSTAPRRTAKDGRTPIKQESVVPELTTAMGFTETLERNLQNKQRNTAPGWHANQHICCRECDCVLISNLSETCECRCHDTQMPGPSSATVAFSRLNRTTPSLSYAATIRTTLLEEEEDIDSDTEMEIAALENRELASKQAALSFYCSTTRPISHQQTGYSAARFAEPRLRFSSNDLPYTYFRDPPPWSVLEDLRPEGSKKSVSVAKPQTVGIAAVNQKAAQKWRDETAKRLKLTAVKASTSARHSEPQPQYRGTPKQNEGGSSTSSTPRSAKPLVPISSLPIPPLPPKQGKDTRRPQGIADRSVVTGKDRPRPKSSGSTDMPKLKIPPASSRLKSSCSESLEVPKASTASNSRGGLPAAFKQQAATSLRPLGRIKSSDPIPSTNRATGIEKKAVKSGSFDWTRWGAR